MGICTAFILSVIAGGLFETWDVSAGCGLWIRLLDCCTWPHGLFAHFPNQTFLHPSSLLCYHFTRLNQQKKSPWDISGNNHFTRLLSEEMSGHSKHDDLMNLQRQATHAWRWVHGGLNFFLFFFLLWRCYLIAPVGQGDGCMGDHFFFFLM
jgi:hypothetical protein